MFRSKQVLGAFAVLVLLVFSPIANAADRGRDEQPSVVERVVRFLKAHIPPVFTAKPADELPTVPHP
jgi:hypothetical protein